MYSALKHVALAIMKTPSEVPAPPAGTHGSVQVLRASPRYLSYRLLWFWIATALPWLALFVLVLAGLVSGQWPLALLGALIAPPLAFVQFLAYFAIRIDYELRYYLVTDRSLRVREGAITVKEMTVTHANVQNLRVVQGPLERLFGIARLEVDTAGGGTAKGEGAASAMGHGVRLAGIENAHEIRGLILEHLKQRKGGAGLGDLDDEHAMHASTSSAVPADRALLAALASVRNAARGLRAAAETSR